jgi:hypothetical protein
LHELQVHLEAFVVLVVAAEIILHVIVNIFLM